MPNMRIAYAQGRIRDISIEDKLTEKSYDPILVSYFSQQLTDDYPNYYQLQVQPKC